VYDICVNTQLIVKPSLTLGARILCAVVQLTQQFGAEAVFSKKEISQKVEQMFPGSADQPGLSTHLSSHCVVNTSKNSGTEQRFMFRVGHGQLRLVRAADLQQNRGWEVSWPNFDSASQEERAMLEWAKALCGSAQPTPSNGTMVTLLDLAGSAKHLFVNESAAEYIATMNEAWN